MQARHQSSSFKKVHVLISILALQAVIVVEVTPTSSVVVSAMVVSVAVVVASMVVVSIVASIVVVSIVASMVVVSMVASIVVVSSASSLGTKDTLNWTPLTLRPTKRMKNLSKSRVTLPTGEVPSKVSMAGSQPAGPKWINRPCPLPPGAT